MPELSCAFEAVIVSGEIGCACARHVTRRGGPGADCSEPASRERCSSLLERLRTEALPTFGDTTDPLELPHSVSVKIMMGGLKGLAGLASNRPLEKALEDTGTLVADALGQAGGLDALPYGKLVEHMVHHRVGRRRGR